ncbi:hypothetical protein YC2023_054766 [Brassica napus]|uniref:Uncharacterized protein n=1 Tax=Brassica oleracea TaxID=3712 RepID=A0A3P6CHA7_BRAOL|nr:unnamed protein product [Brassica oleracea]
MVSDILTRETREWNIQWINSLLPELAAHILSIQPSLLDSQTPTSGRYQRTEPTLSSLATSLYTRQNTHSPLL